jgi:hypothetical protein
VIVRRHIDLLQDVVQQQDLSLLTDAPSGLKPFLKERQLLLPRPALAVGARSCAAVVLADIVMSIRMGGNFDEGTLLTALTVEGVASRAHVLLRLIHSVSRPGAFLARGLWSTVAHNSGGELWPWFYTWLSVGHRALRSTCRVAATHSLLRSLRRGLCSTAAVTPKGAASSLKDILRVMTNAACKNARFLLLRDGPLRARITVFLGEELRRRLRCTSRTRHAQRVPWCSALLWFTTDGSGDRASAAFGKALVCLRFKEALLAAAQAAADCDAEAFCRALRLARLRTCACVADETLLRAEAASTWSEAARILWAGGRCARRSIFLASNALEVELSPGAWSLETLARESREGADIKQHRAHGAVDDCLRPRPPPICPWVQEAPNSEWAVSWAGTARAQVPSARGAICAARGGDVTTESLVLQPSQEQPGLPEAAVEPLHAQGAPRSCGRISASHMLRHRVANGDRLDEGRRCDSEILNTFVEPGGHWVEVMGVLKKQTGAAVSETTQHERGHVLGHHVISPLCRICWSAAWCPCAIPVRLQGRELLCEHWHVPAAYEATPAVGAPTEQLGWKRRSSLCKRKAISLLGPHSQLPRMKLLGCAACGTRPFGQELHIVSFAKPTVGPCGTAPLGNLCAVQ